MKSVDISQWYCVTLHDRTAGQCQWDLDLLSVTAEHFSRITINKLYRRSTKSIKSQRERHKKSTDSAKVLVSSRPLCKLSKVTFENSTELPS